MSGGWRVYTFIGAGGARFMCSWDTEETRARQLAADIREVIGRLSARPDGKQTRWIAVLA